MRIWWKKIFTFFFSSSIFLYERSSESDQPQRSKNKPKQLAYIRYQSLLFFFWCWKNSYRLRLVSTFTVGIWSMNSNGEKRWLIKYETLIGQRKRTRKRRTLHDKKDKKIKQRENIVYKITVLIIQLTGVVISSTHFIVRPN